MVVLRCTSCHKKVFPEGDTYRCPKCSNKKAEPMYRISVIAIDPKNIIEDNPPYIELVFFKDMAQELIGVPALDLAALSTTSSEMIPSQITSLYNHKYTVTVSVPFSSLQRDNISYQVKSIINIAGPVVVLLPKDHSHLAIQTTQDISVPPNSPTNIPATNDVSPQKEEEGLMFDRTNLSTPLPSPHLLPTTPQSRSDSDMPGKRALTSESYDASGSHKHHRYSHSDTGRPPVVRRLLDN
ncbi:uncharacterized protein LOC133904933 [Phragmites australis]|uniref:uncharacterized protein LOC133904933 n=1 Tax=Phragmites australis TaxID=29695 RepID=UPI002D7745E6|nr:uncharacterized protein LOC133904933 [Phragmites australis]XP_062202570.1 uncharacterized protein LOC133904933 [Phragmites australis]